MHNVLKTAFLSYLW